ncbi:MAG: hypothetical protein ACI81S_002025 [Sphingobacteriales bacterium]|jgi:hypothetical protein
MKKQFKLILPTLLAVAVGFASCSEDDETITTPY